MRLTLDALETLDAIAEHGSFARAAEALHRVPSAVTYSVQKLESDLNVQIFDRSGKRAKLTPAGEALLERGRDLLRQAQSLENSVKQVAHGWETQLTMAVDELVPLELMYPLVSGFDSLVCGTRLRFTSEIFGGAWDALIDRRADLAVGAPGEMPQGYGLVSRALGAVEFVFACAPHHPLADHPEPIPDEVVAQYRGVVAADSSRKLAPRSGGIQLGQETMVVPTLAAKIAAQVAGLGVGFLPAHLVAPQLASGALVVRKVASLRAPTTLHVAWRGGEEGRALQWFRDRLLEPDTLQTVFSR